MNVLTAGLFLVVGLVVLGKSANLLVSGAVRLAERLGVSSFVVGLTVVAMGTSAPEAASSIAAVIRGLGDVAVGNVYGSNIANLALVGGLASLIRPIGIKKQVLRRELPVMLVAALLLWPALNNLYLSRPEGALLLSVFVLLIALRIYTAKRQKSNELTKVAAYHIRKGKRSLLLVVVGLGGLALGADLAIRGAVVIGQKIGLSEAVIGLSIVAVGTSLPELATCVAAALKGHNDISIGNLVGSNIFNTLLVTGSAGLVRPFWITQRLAGTDFGIMIAVSVVFAGIALARRRIGRLAGAVLLCGYAGYIVCLLA